jgi:electron transport complex protein RnfD
MLPARIHSYLLWRSQVRPPLEVLGVRRFTTAISLLPAVITGIFIFGWYAGLVLTVSLLAAAVTDWVCDRRLLSKEPRAADTPSMRLMLESSRRDGVWLLTGLLIGLLMPPSVPLWIPIIASVAAVLLGKYVLSVDGMPLLQPATIGFFLVGAIFIGYVQPKQWPILARQVNTEEPVSMVAQFVGGDVRKAIPVEQYREKIFRNENPDADAVSKTLPLDAVKAAQDKPEETGIPYGFWDMFLGSVPGPIGTSALALLLGILLLLFSGAGGWLQPFSALGAMLGGLAIVGWLAPQFVRPGDIAVHLLSGGTLLGVFYLAADPVTAPRSSYAKILSGLTFGLAELAIRFLTPLGFGLFVSAPLTQGLAPLFDKLLPPKAGGKKPAFAKQSDLLSGDELQGSDFFAPTP